MRYVYQWVVFWLGVILGGLSFPAMFWRADERRMLENNFGLDMRDADGKASDGLQEGFARVFEPGRLMHDVKNIPFELTKSRPKVVYKLLSFAIVFLLACIAMMLFLYWVIG